MPDASRILLDAMVAKAEPGRWADAGQAIMTTDTYPKYASAKVRLGDVDVTINRDRQGLGHDRARHGDDARLRVHRRGGRRAFLQSCLSAANESTFTCITVDSDTSTSDTVLLFATGKAGNAPLAASTTRSRCLRRGAARRLPPAGPAVVRDGEGAQKLIEITVTGADQRRSAHADRPRHRQLAAGQDRDRRRGRQLGPGRHGRRQGRRTRRPRPPVGLVRRHPRRAQGERDSGLLRRGDVALTEGRGDVINVESGSGGATPTVWTCDLTQLYLEINADYRS